MSFHVLYAPHPPQFTLELTVQQLACRDARFAHLRTLRERGLLDLAVQDSADLQNAHLTLRQGGAEWRGTPGALDEHHTFSSRPPFAGWSELALEYGLGLDLGPSRVREVNGAEIGAELNTWQEGVVSVFAHPAGTAHAALSRRLNLANFFDRLEVGFLAQTAWAGFVLVRAHRLGAHGAYEVLRAWLPAGRHPLSQASGAETRASGS